MARRRGVRVRIKLRASATATGPAGRRSASASGGADLHRMPLRTAFPDSGSTRDSSASTLLFTPGCSEATRIRTLGRRAPVAVRNRDDAGHDRVGDLHRRLHLAGGERTSAWPPSASPNRSASAGFTCIVQRSLPATSGRRLCIQELFERSWRARSAPSRPSARRAGPAVQIGHDRLRRELDLPDAVRSTRGSAAGAGRDRRRGWPRGRRG